MSGNTTIVYLLRDLNAYKIGITNNLPRRLKQLSTGNAYIRVLAHSKPMSLEDAQWLETALHIKYADKRVRGEWFSLGPRDVKEVLHTLGGPNPSISLYQKVMWLLVLGLGLTGAIICASMNW